MAATADLVARNFRWRLESLTPTDQHSTRKFVWAGRVTPDQSPGTVRIFSVRWLGSERAHEVEDTASRCAYHRFQLDVAYPADVYDPETIQDVMLQDRHDVIKVLRDSRYWVGYDGSSTADLGLYDRDFERDDRIDSSTYTALWRSTWRCLILETE